MIEQPSAQATSPMWFRNVLARAPQHSDVQVDGLGIHLRCWGDAQQPTLLLVHGAGAHSGWWDHIAPLLADTHRVVALDLSGHGDSERRTDYSLTAWAREVVAAAVASGTGGPTTVIGHSMGGWVGVTAAIEHRDDIDAVVVIDSPTTQRAPGRSRLLRANRATARYASREAILARFTTVPHQETVLNYVAKHIAGQSIRRDNMVWTWKFDPFVFQSQHLAPVLAEGTTLDAMLADTTCHAAFLRCEYGIVGRQMSSQIQTALRPREIFVELAEAGHHPMLDQPLPLVASLRTVLSCWHPSLEHRDTDAARTVLVSR